MMNETTMMMVHGTTANSYRVYIFILLFFSLGTVYMSQNVLFKDVSTRGVPKDSSGRSNEVRRAWNKPDLTFTLSASEREQDKKDIIKDVPGISSTTVVANARNEPDQSQSVSTSKQPSARAWNQPDLTFTVSALDREPSKWQMTKLPLCTRDEIIDGEWVPVRLDKPPYVTNTVHLRCYPRDVYYQGYYDTYKWQPKAAAKPARKCDFTKWRASQFCLLLSQATVAIVGDSLSWEHYASLVQLLGGSTHQGYQHQSREFQTNIQQSLCDGETAIVYRRDDRLTMLEDALEQTFPTVLVLNRGAHHVNDTEHIKSIRGNLEHVRKWLHRCDELGIRCHFFWRTSVPGHPHCENFTRPVNDLSAMEAHVGNRSLYNERQLGYHWFDYQHQNELTLRELEASGLEFEVIDAYLINMLRPDEHRAHQGDCLHNCYPGKMDVYSQLLLHYLRQRVSEKDVERMEVVAKEQGWKTDVTTVYDREGWETAKKIREGKRDKA